MTNNEPDQGLSPAITSKWNQLRKEIPILPPLTDLSVERSSAPAPVIEFVRVVKRDSTTEVPNRPADVSAESIEQLLPWSAGPADQKRMHRLVGTVRAGSLTKVPCSHCGGSKELTCKKCSGSGQLTCTACSGSGERECPSCSGSGQRSDTRTIRSVCDHRGNNGRQSGCSRCDGTGYYSEKLEEVTESCRSCDGSGEVDCSACHGGRVRCNGCQGRGAVVCQRCGPDGMVWQYVTREIAEEVLGQSVIPVSGYEGLPEDQAVRLPLDVLTIAARTTDEPFDVSKDAIMLANVASPPTPIFFQRAAEAMVSRVRDRVDNGLLLTVFGERRRTFTLLHQLPLARDWSPETQKKRYVYATVTYGLGAALVAAGLTTPLYVPVEIFPKVSYSLLGAAGVDFFLAYLLDASPARAIKGTFSAKTCARHAGFIAKYCPSCKEGLCAQCLTEGNVCPHCGQPHLRSIDAYIHENRYTEAQNRLWTSDSDMPNVMAYAPTKYRVGAFFIDYFLVIFFMAFSSTFPPSLSWLLWAGPAAYYTICIGRWGQTLGKKLLGVKVVNGKGQAPGYGAGALRFVGYVLGNLTLGIGYLMASFTADKQALHDKMARTYVIKV